MAQRLRGPASRVLVIGRVIPGADSSAGELRLTRLTAMLAERATVDLVAAGSDRPADESARIRAARTRGVRVPFGGGAVHLGRLLIGRPYRLIIAESWYVAEPVLPLARAYQADAVVAVDTIDLHFLRDERAGVLAGARDPGYQLNMERELGSYHGADVRIFVSDTERELYEGLPGSRADGNVVIPIIVERQARPRRPRAGEVVFVGGLWHAPNMDGVFWFCANVWPKVRAAVPGARLRLIGSNPWSLPIDTAALSDIPGVEVEGLVADLDTVYAEAAVVVAPLRFGAGMKGKVCEAMAAGVPVVTTTVGAEGIRAVPGRDLLVADEADDLARAVASVLSDDGLASSVGSAGAAAIQAQCGADAVRPAVHGLIGGLTQARARPRARPGGGEELARRLVAGGWRLGRRLQAMRQQAGT